MNKSVSKLKVGDKVQVGKDAWVVTRVNPHDATFLTSNGYDCKLSQQIVLTWICIG